MFGCHWTHDPRFIALAFTLCLHFVILPCLASPSDPRGAVQALDEPLGERIEAGQTWGYRNGFGRVARKIAVDDLGYTHVAFMRFSNSSLSNRHVFYNVWDPIAHDLLFDDGAQIDAASRAGYPCLVTLPSGWCFPTYHCTVGQQVRCGISIDYLPRLGAFTTTYPFSQAGPNAEFLWPRVTLLRDSSLHMACLLRQDSEPEEHYRLCYARGHPQWDSDGFGLEIGWDQQDLFGDYTLFDTLEYSSAVDIACSQVNGHVALAYSRDGDLWFRISEDEGYWEYPENITESTAADTFRIYEDCSILFDRAGTLHVAFLASHVPAIPGDDYVGWSGIWHWDDRFRQFTPIVTHYRLLNESASPTTIPGTISSTCKSPACARTP
ncbi:MAG: hypothetical protein PHI18_01605 [bacterium]|nr:hypothetical protein [bacterium]